MAQPRKPPPSPVTEQLKAERIQQMLRDYPEWRLTGIQRDGVATILTVTDAPKARGLSKSHVELAGGQEQVA